MSMTFSRQEYWSRLPFPFPGNLPDSGIKPTSSVFLALQEDSLLTEPSGKPLVIYLMLYIPLLYYIMLFKVFDVLVSVTLFDLTRVASDFICQSLLSWVVLCMEYLFLCFHFQPVCFLGPQVDNT